MLGRSSPGAVLQVCLLVLRLCSSVSEQTVQKCPQTKFEWDRVSVSLQCQGTNYFHCLKDDTGRFTQLCAQRIWIQEDMCPEFNSRAGKIDVIECPSGQTGCPTTTFWSNAVFFYPECYGNSTKAALLTTPGIHVTMDIPGSDKADSQNMIVIILTVGLAAVVCAVVGVGIYIYRRKRRRSNRRNNQENRNQDEHGLSENTKENEVMQEMQIDNRKQNEADTRGNMEKYEPMLDVERESLLHSVDVQSKGPQGNPPHHDDILSRLPQENPPHPDDIQSKGPQGNPPHHDDILSRVPQENPPHPDDIQSKRPQGNPPHHDDIQIYIPEGPGPGGRFIDSKRILVLVLKKSSPDEITKIIEECKGTFGPKYYYCTTLASYFLKPEQEQKQEATDLLKDFDFKTSGVEAILKKLFDVVSAMTSMAFVVTIPFGVWSSNREKITAIIDKDYHVCTTHYI